MTIDERLDRLKERHEALMRTVELIGADIRDLLAAQRQNELPFEKNERRMGEIMEGIARLFFAAQRHDERGKRPD